VEQQDLSDAVLVLLGHGTTMNAGSAAPVFQHAAELRRRRCCAEVREAFWKQPPQIKEVLAGVQAPRVIIVPIFISEGYFSDAVIPRELGFGEADNDKARVQKRGGQTLVFCKPVGTHPSMTSVLLARAREVIEKFPFPRAPLPKDITLFIAGHGTDRNSNSRKPAELQAELIRARNLYADAQAVFMEEEPRIRNVHEIARTKNIVVVPFFISDGLHVQEDIPVMLGAPERIVRKRLEEGKPPWRNPTEVKEKLIWFAPGVGSEPQIADVILERAREGARAATCNLKPAN
jgi:sirohydrochlorin cobaltochelatase